MSAVTVAGHVDDQHLLSVQVPDSIPPGPVTVLIVPAAATDDADQAWVAGVAREWADELADPRQDIYTLDDGESIDAA